MNFRQRVDAFPTQLWLTILWATIGAGISYLLRRSVPWVNFMSWYAIVWLHWTCHTGWQSKREAMKATTAVEGKT